MKRLLMPLLILALLLAVASATLTACGGSSTSSADRVFAEKVMKMWSSNDAATAKQLFAENATIYWPEDAAEAPVKGIDAIASTIASYPLDPVLMGDSVYTFVPSTEDMKLLASTYKDSRFIAFPAALGNDAFLTWLELKNGKIQNEWISYMYPFK
ncbi:MAG TPA: hypothetical protein VHS06_05745 [Chloroflexota bacterium]|nr:hypothetical protein [Chloroflexota bacterium]